MISKWFKLCEMTWFTILLTFIKITNHLNYFGSILVFFNTNTLHSFSEIYSNLPLYKMKWNSFFSNILLRLYFSIIYKNLVKIFQKFEVGYIQICTFLKHSTPKWHSKVGHHNMFSSCSLLWKLFKRWDATLHYQRKNLVN